MLLQKVLKWLMITGLIIILLLGLQRKGKMGLKSKFIVLLSKYRALLPYIIAQAKHETGGFTSSLYQKENNMFGMNFPTVRPTVATKGGTYEGMTKAHYTSDAESLKDLLLWMDYVKFPVSVKDSDEYASRLKDKSYFGASLASYQSA